MWTNNTNGEMFQFILNESGSLFSGYYGKYGDSGKTLLAGATKSDLTDYIRYENVSITIPASARYVDIPLSYTCNYVRSVFPLMEMVL